MTKLNPKHGNETKSDIFSWDIFKSDTMSFLLKNTKIFQWLSEAKFFNFMTNVAPNNGKETESDIFPWGIFKSDTNIIF